MVRNNGVKGFGVAKFKGKAVAVAIGALFASGGVMAQVVNGANVAVASSVTSLMFLTDHNATIADGLTVGLVSALNTSGGLGGLSFTGSATVTSFVGYDNHDVITGSTVSQLAPLKYIAGGATNATVTFASNVNARAIVVSGLGTMTFSNALFASTLNFAAAGGTVNIASGSFSGGGAVTAASNGFGTLTHSAGAGVLSFASSVGASGAALGTVNAGSTGTLTFSGGLFATTVSLGNAGSTVTISSGAIGTGGITVAAGSAASQGTVNLLGNTTVSGAVGNSSSSIAALNLGTVGGTANTFTFSSGVFATSVSMADNSVVSIASGAVGNINSASHPDNSALSILGGFTVTGATIVSHLGAGSSAGTTASFIGNTTARFVTALGTGTVQFNNATIVSNLTFAGNATVRIASGTIGTAVTTNTTNTGTLSLLGMAGNVTISGGVGSSVSRLLAVNAGTSGSTGVISFASNVFAKTFTTGGTGLVSFASALTTDTLNIAGTGAVTIASGTIGAITDTAGAILSLGSALTGSADGVSVTGTVSALTLNTGLGNVGVFTFSGTGGVTATTASLGGTTSFTGAVTATTVSVLGSATFTGGLTATTVSIGSGGTLTIGAGKNLSGTVNGAGGNTPVGTLTFAGGTTISTAIGSTASLLAVNFTGSTANTVNIGANINALTTTVTGLTSAIFTANTTNTGTDFRLGPNASLDFGTKAITVSSLNVVDGGAGTIKTTLNAAGTTGGTLAMTASASIGANTKYVVTVGTTLPTNGLYIKLIDGVGGSASSLNVTSSNSLVTFTAVATADGVTSTQATSSGDKDIWLLAAVKSGSAALAALGVSTDTAAPGVAALSAMSTSTNASIQTLLTTVGNLVSSGVITGEQAAAKIVAPAGAIAAATGAASGAASAGLGSVSTRLASLRGDTVLADANSVGTGISGGDKGRDQAFWIKANGLNGTQTKYDGFSGYGVTSAGFAAGADADIGGDWRMGGAYTYGDTSVSMKDANQGDSTKVKTHQLTVYGMKEMGEMYIDTMAAFAVHRYTGSRSAIVGAAVGTATSSYSGNQWTLSVGGGYRMPMGGGTVLTPIASLMYSANKVDTYTESSTNIVQGQTTSGFKSGLGVRYSGDSNWGGTAVKPEIHAVWHHDFGAEKTDSTTSILGVLNVTNTGQKIQRETYNLGGGVAFLPNKTSKITVSYDYDTRTNYAGHAVSLTGRWNF